MHAIVTPNPGAAPLTSARTIKNLMEAPFTLGGGMKKYPATNTQRAQSTQTPAMMTTPMTQGDRAKPTDSI